MNFKRKLAASFLVMSLITCAVSAQYNITMSGTEGCTPFTVTYSLTSTATVDTLTSFLWDFGNGQTSTLRNPPPVQYNEEGVFSPSLKLNNLNSATITRANALTVHRTVYATFRYYDTVSYYTYVFEPTDVLDNSATYTYLWNFEDVGTKNERRETITFPRVDSFNVSLTITDNHGCTSTESDVVIILEDIVVQNVFTPNNDNTNDFFIVISKGSYPLRIKIFSRSGTMVYENEGYTIAWDGRTASGLELSSGVYFYVIEALYGDPYERYSKSGVLYLYR